MHYRWDVLCICICLTVGTRGIDLIEAEVEGEEGIHYLCGLVESGGGHVQAAKWQFTLPKNECERISGVGVVKK